MTQYYVLNPKMNTFGLADTARDNTFSYRLQFRAGPVKNAPELTWQWTRPQPPPDWVATIDSVRLVSPVVRRVFDEHAGPADEFQWLPATVTTSTGESLPYWVLHFSTWFDVLDEEHSNWGPSGLPMRWVLSRAKLEDHHVVAVPRLITLVIVTEPVLDALQQAGVTGYVADRARIV